ncbi:hypothetical protein CLIB1444_02S08768 [[Candida] jaroonii]|uniref:Uncharacterized protein n=1 Tax=[Candida] jaroonii TaxID=467808 RepID=A0ACA9Y3D8_9ASCO|nr:hypothetical protein CLIB1444_02S08768 [[Candida] jaroonii]
MMITRRLIHTSKPRLSLLSDWFGQKKTSEPVKPQEPKVKKDLIKDQDDFETSQSKIVFLNRDNSPNIKKFNAEVDMPDFKITTWKSKNLTRQEIENSYDANYINSKLLDIYKSLKNEEPTLNTELSDLSFRFQYAKTVQSELGIDIPDLSLTKSHTISILNDEILNIISKRFKSERNPNDINLRPEDFNASNVYVNQELNEAQQAKKFKELVEKAKQEL